MEARVNLIHTLLVLGIDGFQRLHLHCSIGAVCPVSLDVLGIEKFHQLLAHEVGLVVTVVALKVFHYEDRCVTMMRARRSL